MAAEIFKTQLLLSLKENKQDLLMCLFLIT